MNEQSNDKSSMTRKQYRQQREEADREFQERDRKRIQVEKEYARTHRQAPEELVSAQQELTEHKVAKLKRKLNWTIFYLVLGIILVMLILFFVD